MRLLPRSLKLKFSLFAGLLFLVIFTIASYVLIGQSTDFQRQSLLSRAKTFASLATQPLGDSYNLYFDAGRVKFIQVFQETLQLNNTVPRAQIISVEGKVLFDSNNFVNGEVAVKQENPDQVKDAKILQAVAGDKSVDIKNSDGNISELIVPYSNTFGSRPFSIRYFLSYDSINDNINKAIFTTLLLVVFIFVTTQIAITLLVNRSILSPLGKIVSVAHAISGGDLKKKIEVNTKDELDDLAVSLNQMTDKLRQDIDDLKEVDKLKDEFILVASHNLRTPLTVIKGFIPILKEKKQDEEASKILSSIETNTGKLETITESLLNLVSLEKGKQTLLKRKEDLVSIVTSLIDSVKLQAEKKKVQIKLELPDQPVFIEIDKIKMRQALLSVFDNAVKFNKEGGVVTIKMEVKDGSVVTMVEDTGIGIAKEEIEKTFQKFHRGTDVLQYNYEGIGLGLYLAKVIVESHEGKIWIESELGKGTKVFVSLPTTS